MRIMLIAILLLVVPIAARASVVDAGPAEELFQAGDFKAALDEFTVLLTEFSHSSTDSTDWHVYREAAYLGDRLSDCCFTQRDWANQKRYLDGVLMVSTSERNLLESQFAASITSGVAYATAKHLSERLDEAVRLTTIVQLKRTISLVLLETGGQGPAGEEAIRQYQKLVAATRQVVEIEDGIYSLNIGMLEQNIDLFDDVFMAVDAVADIEALWEKYPPEGSASPAE